MHPCSSNIADATLEGAVPEWDINFTSNHLIYRDATLYIYENSYIFYVTEMQISQVYLPVEIH